MLSEYASHLHLHHPLAFFFIRLFPPVLESHFFMACLEPLFKMVRANLMPRHAQILRDLIFDVVLDPHRLVVAGLLARKEEGLQNPVLLALRIFHRFVHIPDHGFLVVDSARAIDVFIVVEFEASAIVGR